METLNEQEIRTRLGLVIKRLMHLGDSVDESKFSNVSKENMKFVKRDAGIMTWDWPQGVGLYGLDNMMRFDGNDDYRKFLLDWYAGNMEKGLPPRNINTTAPLLTLTDFTDQNPEYAELCREWADWLISSHPKTEEGGFQHVTSGGLNEQQLWMDTLFMAVLFLNKMGQKYKNRVWIDESVHQFLMHIKYLCDNRTGLFYHGWTFIGRNNFGGIFWCRGNSWFTVGASDYLETAGDSIDAGTRKFIEDAYRAQVKALCALQGEDGLWHTVLTDAGSYEEASGSAAIAAGIFKGIRTGILDASCGECAGRAVRALLSCIREDGTVEKVSAGTGMGMNEQFYKDIAIMPMAYGQSLTMLALIEALRYLAAR